MSLPSVDAPLEPRRSAATRTRRGARLASTAAGLGGVGLMLSVVFIGVVPAVVGLVLAAAHYWLHPGLRAASRTGLWLSALGMLASLAFLVAYRQGRHPLQFLLTTVSQRVVYADPLKAWEGRPLPDVEWIALDGSTHRLSDWRGRRVVLDFWATWCPPCVREIPHFKRLAESHATNDLTVLGVTAEPASVVRPFVGAQRMSYPVATAAYQEWPEPFALVTALPTTFFVDREGILRRVVVGYHDWNALRRLADDLDREVRDGKATLAP